MRTRANRDTYTAHRAAQRAIAYTRGGSNRDSDNGYSTIAHRESDYHQP